jgi:catechol 2,3-dioxygenase-like lactoylglutathione lyase family enzyme
MKVLRVCFVGTRTSDFEATTGMFRDVLGMKQAFVNPGWAGFHLASGERDLVEVFGGSQIDQRLLPEELRSGVLVAFAVDDVVTARQELSAAGIELIGDVVWASDLTGNRSDEGWGWCFFRGTDDNIYVLQQDGLTDPR